MSSSPTSCDTSHLLRSNTAPTPIEVASLQHEIDYLTSKITQARVELDTMEMNLQERKAALSPIRRIPLEVIAQIIRYVAWGVLHSPGRRELVRLTLVCKSWRNAALLCNEQWAGIHIEKDEIREPGAFDKIVSWYRRAGSLPKTLEFRLGRSKHCYCDEADLEEISEATMECEFLHPTLIRLLTEGPAIDHILLVVTQTSCFRKLLRAIGAIDPPSDTARLWDAVRWLEIDFSDPDEVGWDDALDPAQSIFNYLPQINSFTLCLPLSYAVFEEDSTAARAVPLHVPPNLLQNLTSFTIQCDWEGRHILDMLPHCHNVQTLKIDIGGNDILSTGDDGSNQQAPASRVLLPRLHTLHLQGLGTTCILNHFKTPMLRNLQLAFDFRFTGEPPIVDSDFHKTFEQFINDSSCAHTIRSLELKGQVRRVIGMPRVLADAITILPSLERLSFSEMTPYLKNLLNALTERVAKGSEDGQPCLPCLRDLELLDVPFEMGISPISGLVDSLSSPSLRLTVVYKSFPLDNGTQEEDDLLGAICRSGVSVRVIPEERLEWYTVDDKRITTHGA